MADDEPVDLDALLAGLEKEEADDKKDEEPDLDALLAGLEAEEKKEEDDAPDLDALLAGLEADEKKDEKHDAPDLDALLAGLESEEKKDEEDGAPDLDALLAGLTTETPAPAPAAPAPAPAPVAAPAPPARAPAAPAPVAAAPAPAPAPTPPPPAPPAAPARPAAPTLQDPPADLAAADADAWRSLNQLILTSWSESDTDQGRLWFTVVGRQGPPVILVGTQDTEPNRTLARPGGDAGRRVASQSGQAFFVRNSATNQVSLRLTSGIGAPDARKKVSAELERLRYFAGAAVKF